MVWLVSRVFIAQNGSVYRLENRIYNEDNLLIETNFQEHGEIKQQVRYKYNDKSQLIEEDNQKHIKLYFYNDDGLCCEQQLHTENEHIQSFLYYYDEYQNMVELREESPIGQTCRLHKYSYNQKLVSSYQLINQDGLILTNLEYKYSNFIGDDWLERYTWRLSGRSGKLSYHSLHSCLRSPCWQSDSNYESYFCRDFKTLELPEGNYYGKTTNLGIMHGQGRLDFFDGSCYVGRFDNGCMDGYGCFYWPDGRLYCGYFEKNRMQGLGNYYLADGSLYRGTFAEGQLLSSEPYFYLAGTSPLSKLSKLSRRLRKAQANYKAEDVIDIGEAEPVCSRVEQVDQLEEQAEQLEQAELNKTDDERFIELATRAVQQQKLQQESIEQTEPLVDEQHNLDLFSDEHGIEDSVEDFMAEDFIDAFPAVQDSTGNQVDEEFMLETVAMNCGQADGQIQEVEEI